MSLIYSDRLLRETGLTNRSGVLSFVTGLGYILEEQTRVTKLNISASQSATCSELIGKRVNVSGLIYDAGERLQVYYIHSND